MAQTEAGGRAEPTARRPREPRFGLAGASGIAMLLVSLSVAVVVLGFSVRVSGTSMEPTLHDGDRLEVDLLHQDVRRFDLVDATQPGERESGGGTRIVKRVIGLPGDQVSIAGDATAPRIMLRVAGSDDVLLVENPAWDGRIGTSTASCCTADGKSTSVPTWVTVPPDAFWLIGDNWGGSTDSRVFGFVTEDEIQTRLVLRILPPGRFGRLDTSARLVPAS